MWHIASQVTELKRIVNRNVETLIELRSHYDQPEQMRELVKKLTDVDSVLKRMTIIGEMMCFRSLLQEALNDVLKERIPFLLGSIKDFHHSANSSMIELMHLDNNNVIKVVDEMASSAGIECKVDSSLVNALRNQKNDIKPEEKYQYASLASSSLLRLGQETGDKEAIRNRESVYILLDLIVQESPFLTMDLLESCFPHALIRNAYHEVYKHISVNNH
ncbi:hypothetical protein BLA29_000670 [Euroglyphus maynei]|uniref:Uncharacterized protein n=1 Tax=Euroglyphus maynei TaxID=6958 RepID=A0A1Y3BBR1_EURMA|nr:hypothetical protein BLA29_000670 [Euroglyphus maynei]